MVSYRYRTKLVLLIFFNNHIQSNVLFGCVDEVTCGVSVDQILHSVKRIVNGVDVFSTVGLAIEFLANKLCFIKLSSSSG